tara:strand:- start:442 stop:696 length:255 start_codon:yes stop_codon:yes gene_type:complete
MKVGYLVENNVLGLGTVESEVNKGTVLVKWFKGEKSIISIHKMKSHYLESIDERGHRKYKSWYWRLSGLAGKDSEVRIVSEGNA